MNLYYGDFLSLEENKSIVYIVTEAENKKELRVLDDLIAPDYYDQTLKLKGPLYEYFPLSVFAEVLIPWQITDEHNVTFNLEEGKTKKPLISPIEQPQPTLPAPKLKRIIQ